jgi:hypothetical protein
MSESSAHSWSLGRRWLPTAALILLSLLFCGALLLLLPNRALPIDPRSGTLAVNEPARERPTAIQPAAPLESRATPRPSHTPASTPVPSPFGRRGFSPRLERPDPVPSAPAGESLAVIDGDRGEPPAIKQLTPLAGATGVVANKPPSAP